MSHEVQVTTLGRWNPLPLEGRRLEKAIGIVTWIILTVSTRESRTIMEHVILLSRATFVRVVI